MTEATSSASLARRRSSYDVIPRFFFPKHDPQARLMRNICHNHVLHHINNVFLTREELQDVISTIKTYVQPQQLSKYQKVLVRKVMKKTGILAIDTLQEEFYMIPLSYQDYRKLQTQVASTKVAKWLQPHTFLMFAQDTNGRINGFSLLEFVCRLQISMLATQLLCERDLEATGALSEEEYSNFILRFLRNACQSPQFTHLQIDDDFVEYYQLICTRRLVLAHDFKKANGKRIAIDALSDCKLLHALLRLVHPEFARFFDPTFVSSHPHALPIPHPFHPTSIRQLHRQYVQLDADKNGMLSAAELREYGKKKAFNPDSNRPTHDFTQAFITQVFAEVTTYPPHDEMDYKGFMDFTILMLDNQSLTSLRFFWNVLDFQKQGYLDAFSIDYFLRDLIRLIHSHDEEEHVDLHRIRTEIFDSVAPESPDRITWDDLKQCKLGHSIVRLLTDYVAYRSYEDAGGQF